MSTDGIGAAIKRKEDHRFLTGKGRYTDDFNRPGQGYAVMVRSPHAHANITGIDKSAAEGMPGVLRVFTNADMEADGIVGALPAGWVITNKDGSQMKTPGHPILAKAAPTASISRVRGTPRRCMAASRVSLGRPLWRITAASRTALRRPLWRGTRRLRRR